MVKQKSKAKEVLTQSISENRRYLHFYIDYFLSNNHKLVVPNIFYFFRYAYYLIENKGDL
jgi:hypothetical protein